MCRDFEANYCDVSRNARLARQFGRGTDCTLLTLEIEVAGIILRQSA